MKKLLLIAAMAVGFSSPAWALTMEPGSDAPTRNIEDYIEKYVDVPKGAVNWTVFGKTKEIQTKNMMPDGFYNFYSKPDFPADVKALDGKEIKIRGFMFPLDPTDAQNQFLFGPFPVNCPFQYHVGPTLVMEVHADKHPIDFSYDPITITGILQLVPDDPEYGTFYRLLDAQQVKNKTTIKAHSPAR